MSRLKDPNFPMPQDEALRIAPMTTVTSSGSLGLLDQGAGFAPGSPVGEPMALTLNVPALKTTAGNETYTAKVQYSDDASTWTDATPAVALTAAGAKAIGIFVKHRYHQLVLALGGTSPSVTLEAFLNPFVW